MKKGISERGKRKEEKKVSQQTENSASEQENNSTSEQLAKQIKDTTKGLLYNSETEAEVLPFVGKSAKAVTKEEILNQTKNSIDSPIEEKDFAAFFSRLTEIQDWFGDEEKETSGKFAQLQKVLENNLRDLKVFKVGEIQIKIYVVGLDENNVLLGIKTEAVETG